MIDDIDLDLQGLLRQASMTADDYLAKAHNILERNYDAWSISDAIELSKVMAQDFHTSLMGVKMQEIRDAIYELSTRVEEGLS